MLTPLPFFGRPLPRPFLDFREFLFACTPRDDWPETKPSAAFGHPPNGPSSLVE